MAIQLPYTDGFIAEPSTSNAETKDNKGVPNGYAPLDGTGKVPSGNLPTIDVSGQIATHNSATTSVHGIADTAELATKTYADDAVFGHKEETTSIHGIVNTGELIQSTAIGPNTDKVVTFNQSGGVGDNSEIGAWGFGVSDGSADSYIDPTGLTVEGSGKHIYVRNDKIELDNGAKLRKGTTDAGGNKGIALECTVHYELKWEAGRLYTMQSNGTTIRSVEHCMSAPTTTDDETKGYVIGTRWVMDSGKTYICTDATEDSATWELKFSQEANSGGGGGSINLSASVDNGGGSINTSGGGSGGGGDINTSGGADGGGGSINTSGGNDGGGGGIDTSNNGGYIVTSSGGGYISTAGAGEDGAGGYINTSADGNGSNGGSINTGSGEDGNGGSINTSNNGGSINTSNGGGSIDTTGGGFISTNNGGYINTAEGGYINTSDDGGFINTSGNGIGAGGSINTSQGSDNGGGSINTSGGDDGSGGSINTSNGGGSIDTSGGDGEAGGSINTSSGSGYVGGSINTSSVDGNGGSINTTGNDGETGGSINTSGGATGAGGSINTSNGGGSINTLGVGEIQLGVTGTRTTLVGSASATNKTITLPNATGTVALEPLNFRGYSFSPTGATTADVWQATYTIPADAMGLNGYITADIWASCNTGTSTAKRIRVWITSTNPGNAIPSSAFTRIVSFSTGTSTTATSIMRGFQVYNRNSVSSQIIHPSASGGVSATTSSDPFEETTYNTANPLYLVVGLQKDNTADTLQLKAVNISVYSRS